jgi:hypothetical protein
VSAKSTATAQKTIIIINNNNTSNNNTKDQCEQHRTGRIIVAIVDSTQHAQAVGESGRTYNTRMGPLSTTQRREKDPLLIENKMAYVPLLPFKNWIYETGKSQKWRKNRIGSIVHTCLLQSHELI